jgi:hypothetical protein
LIREHLHIKRAANLKSNYPRARTASLRFGSALRCSLLGFIFGVQKRARAPLDAIPTASFHIRVDMNRVQHRAATRSTGRIHQTAAAAVNARRECVLLAAAAAHNAFSILSLVIRSPSTKRENYAPPMVLYKKKCLIKRSRRPHSPHRSTRSQLVSATA